MFIKELDLTTVDSLGNFLSNLVRTSSLDHVESRPTILRLCTGRRPDEKGVFQLTLQVVLLDVVRQCSGDFPVGRIKRSAMPSRISFKRQGHTSGIQHQ